MLSVALVMLLWHCVWVSSHTKQMITDARNLGMSVQQGQRAPWALLVVVALAVLREGAETVLFVSGSLSGASGGPPGAVLLSVVSGLGLGALVGMVIYAGLSRVPTRHMFSVTNVLMALLAASLASQLVRSLTQAGFLESWTGALWDSSKVLAQDSTFGTFLHALMGYDARPSAAQLSAYLTVLAFIYIGTRWMNGVARRAPQAR